MTAADWSSVACRACGGKSLHRILDLGDQPLANSYLETAEQAEHEARYPLRAVLCDDCRLMQLDYSVPPEIIFSDYAYLSSISDNWVEHARRFALSAIERFALDAQTLVLEIASNDGYLLQHFVAQGVPVLGIEPAGNIAKIAQDRGVRTENRFFNPATAAWLVETQTRPRLIVANNVLAHVPDLFGFISALSQVMTPETALSIEVPHLLKLLQDCEFDTIYHEHYSYFSLMAVENCLRPHGLRVFDVEELPTHGGSLRLFVCSEDAGWKQSPNVNAVRAKETAARLDHLDRYAAFADQAYGLRGRLLAFLRTAKSEGKVVAAYGAAAKGNTLLNYCQADRDLIAFAVDRSPLKQGRLMPGSHIPILAPDVVFDRKPDYLLVLPWNLIDEIEAQMAGIRKWNGRFVVPIPDVEVRE